MAFAIDLFASPGSPFMNKLARLVCLFALVLVCTSATVADTLQVTFSASFPFAGFYQDETVTGSFLWNTDTNSLYGLSVSSTGLVVFNSSSAITGQFVSAPGFSGCGFGGPFYPAGTLQAFFISDSTGTGNVQMNLSDHADCDPPVVPGPGSYFEPFDLVPPGGGVIPSQAANPVTVSLAPEPGLISLLAFGSFLLAGIAAAKRLRS